MKNKTTTVIVLSIITTVIVFIPLFVMRGADFEGTDTIGSEMINEANGGIYEPWFKPVLETFTGGELSGEIETLFFCIQTGIGVGIIAYCFGYLYARKKYGGDTMDEKAVEKPIA
jgi:cobalt/nickel transport protein